MPGAARGDDARRPRDAEHPSRLAQLSQCLSRSIRESSASVVEEVAGGEASDPLAWRDGVLSVRWSVSAGYVPLEGYLRERIALLLDPPSGA